MKVKKLGENGSKEVVSFGSKKHYIDKLAHSNIFAKNKWIKNHHRILIIKMIPSLVIGDPVNFLDKDHKYDIFFTS